MEYNTLNYCKVYKRKKHCEKCAIREDCPYDLFDKAMEEVLEIVIKVGRRLGRKRE